MDNLTHTLIGVTLAQAVVERRPELESRARSAIFWTAILGNNFPDLDFAVGALAGHGKLGYLLNHRGHSHTLALLPPGALAVSWIGARIGGLELRRNRWLAGLGALSVGLHLLADSWNEYGIHPFWPLDNRWYYGDFVFILEPTLWMAMLPLAILVARARIWKGAGLLLEALLLSFLWAGPFASRPLALGLTAWNAACALLCWRARRRSLAAIACVLLALAAFKTTSVVARQRAIAWLERNGPREKILDVVLSPAPGNPFCWRALAVSRRSGGGSGPGAAAADVGAAAAATRDDELIERPGVVSLWPALFPATSCHPRSHPIRTAPMAPLSIPGAATSDAIDWDGEFRGSVPELRRLAASSCRFAQLIRFARTPYWDEKAEVAGDLRYDNEPGLGFAELELDPALGCLSHVPPWIPPILEKINLNQ